MAQMNYRDWSQCIKINIPLNVSLLDLVIQAPILTAVRQAGEVGLKYIIGPALVSTRKNLVLKVI